MAIDPFSFRLVLRCYVISNSISCMQVEMNSDYMITKWQEAIQNIWGWFLQGYR